MKTFISFLLVITINGCAVAQQPNILWLTSEDNSASWLSCYGNPYAETPHLDQLAKDGFQYMQAHANAPVCAPSRSTWITGVNAVSMGTHPMRSEYPIPHDKIKYYPDYLREVGYYTANYTKKDYNIGGRDDICWNNDSILDWNELKNKQPFFQVINFNASHESKAFGDVNNTDHDPAKTILAAYHPDLPEMRKNYAHYHDAIKQMDAEIGAKLKALDEMGLAENTIVVYVSDHGGVLPRSKRFLFKNSLHCPLIIRIPEKYKHLYPAEKPGDKVDRLVSFIDMPKTWLSIAGITVPEYMQGKIFLGPETEVEQKYHFAFRGRMDERFDNARALCNKRYLYIRNYMPYLPWMQHLDFLWTMKATQVWEQAFLEGSTNEVQSRFFKPKGWTEELYDTENDPDCVNNLLHNPAYKKTLSEFRKQMRKKQLEIYDAGLLPESDMVRLAEQNNTTIYEMAKNKELYNLQAILDAADLALENDVKNLKRLHKLMESDQLGERYWGMIGGFLLKDKEAGLKMIHDESHEIRAMAAWTLIQTGEKEKGLACLKELIAQRSYALLTVLNMVEWIGEDGKALMGDVNTLTFKETYKNQYKYPIRMQNHLNTVFNVK